MANPTGKGGRRFEKGHPGGPGRPKAEHDIQALARAHAPVAIETLVKIASFGQSESAQVAASTALLDRGFGKPKQTVVWFECHVWHTIR
jgi:hypothetical protein